MSYLTPGREIKRFNSKSGKEIVIRYPRWEDLDELVRYVNKISIEDTYITFSGETISRNDEIEFLLDCYRKMERGDAVHLFALDGNTVIGTCEVRREFTHRTRGYHVAGFGISIENEYRDQGIGYQLSTTVIEEAKKNISGLEMVILDVYSENERAIRMYEKIGFVKAGAFPKGLKYKGRYLDEVKMYMPLV